ncbi:fatty acid desaturase [Streptomyces sp. H10-C2]|uniref:fatty acid desaturase family protein n=1 Tax=unclassified Streptomyces TaxID=2593676 RepID=UPI0024BB0E33|nr:MULTISPECIES: fatty acid desaturase [unclassified Streptomyces]MDJ0344798.1 fatty acid desaturase [Streptomyces sp. PH10-H1]MDJ0369683.1 fatty acid desaturase [Streptomyces sp. H10-C2]
MVEAKPRRFWRNSPADAILLTVTLTQFAGTIALAALTPDGLWPRLASAALVTAMMTYSIIVVTHLFVHQPWFTDNRLNAVLSVVSSANIAQSVQGYHLTHVRNHHRYNNDRKRDGTTADITSTYRYSRDDGHAPLWWYLVCGLASSAKEWVVTWAMLRRGCAVGPRETTLLELAARNPGRRVAELRQVRYDRLTYLAFTVLLAVLSWQWTLLCYLPSVALAFTLVNVQNYYRHFGAEPESRYANSVSHYGRLYNLVTFNDGYHQEHHLRPTTHWSRLPEVAEQYQERFDEAGRVISPVPALVGFLDTGRVGQRSPATPPAG